MTFKAVFQLKFLCGSRKKREVRKLESEESLFFLKRKERVKAIRRTQRGNGR